MIAGNRVCLFYADTYFGRPRKTETTELLEVVQAALKKAKGGPEGLDISPLALEAVKRIDALFDIERAIIGQSAAERLAVRAE